MDQPWPKLPDLLPPRTHPALGLGHPVLPVSRLEEHWGAAACPALPALPSPTAAAAGPALAGEVLISAVLAAHPPVSHWLLEGTARASHMLHDVNRSSELIIHEKIS